jgi:ligand-binding sensor domain-containing protein
MHINELAEILSKIYMKIALSTLIFMFSISIINSQNLYQEKFNDCKLSTFCLDCGDTKAEPQLTIIDEIIKNLNQANFSKAKGMIEAQILIDENGKPCLLSVQNKTNIPTKKLNLKKAINNTSNWNPAITKGTKQNSSVSLILIFENGNLSVKRREFDFKNQSNMKSEGTPYASGTEINKLSKTWTLFTQSNSKLPWDMTRSVVTDLDKNVWIGTDNGIIEINNNSWILYNSKNTIISAPAYNKNETQSIRYAQVDKKNSKWFIAGWDVYKYDNKNWTKFDSLNSPINWARKMYIDHNNNAWFTSWEGVSKFDGKNWTVFNKENSNLPTNKTFGVFVDKTDKIWIGTFEGNVIIQNGQTKLLDDKSSPLSKGFISKVVEDKKGNLWFSIYNDKNYKDEGIFVLDNSNNWTKIDFPNKNKILDGNSINDFLLDEDNQELWITVNGIGALCYYMESKQWEIYTNQNSNFPSIHAEQIAKDANGDIWIATYAGVVKLNRK